MLDFEGTPTDGQVIVWNQSLSKWIPLPINSVGGGTESLTLIDLLDVTAKTGSGSVVVMSDTPTLLTPVIASFTNAPHTHLNAAGGGTLTHAAISDFDTQVRTNRLDQMAAPTGS